MRVSSHFDPEWSSVSDYFTFSAHNSVARFKKGSSYHYASYPCARLNSIPYTSEFSVTLLISGYGWFGIGSADVAPHGFPGYTKEGWMICTDGRLYHNNACLQSNAISVQNKQFTFKCDPQKKTISVIVDGKEVLYNVPELPDAVFFVASISAGDVTIHDATPLTLVAKNPLADDTNIIVQGISNGDNLSYQIDLRDFSQQFLQTIFDVKGQVAFLEDRAFVPYKAVPIDSVRGGVSYTIPARYFCK